MRTSSTHRRHAAAIAIAAYVLVLLGGTNTQSAAALVRSSATLPPDLRARASEDEVDLHGEQQVVDDVPTREPWPPTTERLIEVWEPADCVLLAGVDPILDTWCSGTQDIDLYEIACPDGTDFAWPLKIRTRPDATASWGPWRLGNSPCIETDAEDGTPTDDIATELARQITTLKIPAKHARIAPVTTWFTVQTPMTYYTDPGKETLRTTVLGTGVEIELTPSSYAWDPGDGSRPLHATKPGKPCPDQTITHTYTKVGTWSVTLTTTWQGRFRIDGATTWHDITGTGTTTHTSEPFKTREVRSVLTG